MRALEILKRPNIRSVKLLVSIVLLTVLAWQVDYGEAKAHFAQVEHNAWQLLLALVLLFVQFLVTVVRWQMVLKSVGSTAHMYDVARAAVYGSLSNSVLIFGNLLVRPVMLAQCGVPATRAISSTLFERVLVLIVMVVLSVPGVFLLFERSAFYQQAPSTQLLVAGLALAVLAAVAVLLLYNRESLGHGSGPIWRVFTELCAYFRQRRVVVGAVFLTIASQIAIISSAVLISQAAGLNLEPGLLWMILPPMMLIASLPVSMGGWGIRELAFVLLFHEIGISLSAAISVSVMLGILSIIALLIPLIGLSMLTKNR